MYGHHRYPDPDEPALTRALNASRGVTRVLSANTLSGEPVVNTAGEDLGRIKEIMLDVGGGCVAYAVLAFGGVLGVGAKLFAVPWEALNLDRANKCFILDVERHWLEREPGFDTSRWPESADLRLAPGGYRSDEPPTLP